MALSPRARGANARAFAAFEATPGVVPAAGASWFGFPLVSHSLGEEAPLISSDLLGQGREMQDPITDVVTNDGDLVVPVDVRNFGRWLKLFFGDPATTTISGGKSHAFTSGADQLPSMAIEIGAPEIPSYSVHRGVRGNTLRISLSRSGLLNATLGLIAIGETEPSNTSAAGADATAALDVRRFPQAAGYVRKDGAVLGSVVSADLTFSNQLEKVETIQPDGRIEDSDPGMVMMSGTVAVRFRDTALLTAATSGTPIALNFGWTAGAFGLDFALPRVFLPRAKRPISGPGGILATFNWQASGAEAASVVATLLNDVDTY
jgi:hypothetical protein